MASDRDGDRLLERILPASDRQAIEGAVRRTEAATGCELVVAVVPACDSYHHVSWKGALFGALTGALLGGLASRGLEIWGNVWAWLLLPAPTGAVLGWALTGWPALRRALATPRVMDRRVSGRAAESFLTAQIARTSSRQGLLIFVALFERRVVVLADHGVAAQVEDSAWAVVTSAVEDGMRRGRAGEALTEAVSRCERLLVKHGFHGTPGAANELPDSLRVEAP
ncbi:MAG: hypothetical protein ABI609_12850 [Acidobacteriota bacterium]